MWSSAVVLSALVASVAANYTFPEGFDVNKVKESERSKSLTAIHISLTRNYR